MYSNSIPSVDLHNGKFVQYGTVCKFIYCYLRHPPEGALSLRHHSQADGEVDEIIGGTTAAAGKFPFMI